MARLTRWLFSQLTVLATARSQSESIRLLLNEYEHRGVGWLWQVDAENRVIYISSRMTALLGRSANQLLGHSLPASLGGSSALGHTLMARQPFGNLEMELKTRRGTRWISLSGDPIIDVTGTFQGFRGVGQDITDVRRTQERLTNLANMDVLSGLPNRGRVRQLLGEALSGSADGETPCAIMFLDLDGFKPVNDTFGHPKGDVVLKSVAQRLLKEAERLRPGRPDGRRRIRHRHQGRGQPAHGRNARRPADRRDRRALPHRQGRDPDRRLDRLRLRPGRRAERRRPHPEGRPRPLPGEERRAAAPAASSTPTMQNEAEDRLRLEQDMRAGIRGGQFRLLFQPLINASDQSLMGFEALIRWHHPTRGIVPPNHFIPLAEETGLIMDLGEWVIQEACRAVATWPEHISVAINVSAKQLIYPALPNTINEAIRRYRLQSDRLELEVTESIFLGDSTHALDVLKRLRALGVGIALDDFGTGYSSLGYLNKAVFHKLKIDGSFVREAAEQQGDGGDHPVDRPARQELPDDGHRRGRRDRRRFHPDARSRLPPDPGLSVRPADELRESERAGPRRPAAAERLKQTRPGAPRHPKKGRGRG